MFSCLRIPVMVVFIISALPAIGLGGCSTSAVMPLAVDSVELKVYVAPACGPSGAARMALKQAAVETLRRNFDKFLIDNSHSDIKTMGGHVGWMDHRIVVKMFKDGDAAGAKGIPAKETLGPRWREALDGQSFTCLE
jgi:hypothetical protein